MTAHTRALDNNVNGAMWPAWDVVDNVEREEAEALRTAEAGDVEDGDQDGAWEAEIV